MALGRFFWVLAWMSLIYIFVFLPGTCGTSGQDMSPPVFLNNFTNSTVLTFGNSQTPSWKLTAMDDSGVVTITSSPSPGSYFPLGNTSVNVTATDKYNNVATLTFIVMVEPDGSPETRNCPEDRSIIVDLGLDQVPYAVSWAPPIANGTGNVTTTSNYMPGDMFNEGTTKVTYKFTDDAGRSSKCFFKIRITVKPDIAGPNVVGCPTNVSRTVPAGTMQTLVTWEEPRFTDVVSGTDLLIQQSKTPNSLFPEGTTEVLYLAMDGNFNEARCTFNVTVNVLEDNTPPSIVGCPQSFTHWVRDGIPEATVPWSAPNITDDSNFTTSVSHEPGSMFTVGMDIVVSYNATDIVNNMANCTFTISVRVDNEAPMLECPDNITMLVTQDVMDQVVTWPTPNATDNSGDVTVTTNPPSGTAFVASPSGQNDIVIVMAADNYGNNAMCTFFVNVIYDLAPVLTCPDVIQETAPGQASASDITWPNVTIEDDYTSVSALMNTSTHGSMISSLQYDSPVMVTLTARDERDNVGMCTFRVEVVDREKPVWSNCPENITAEADVGTNSGVANWTLPTVTDNSGVEPPTLIRPSTSQRFSGGVWLVVYSATDHSGNTGTCEFNVTLMVDDDVPVFNTCPTNQELTAASGSDSVVVMWGEITAIDDSGEPVITSNFVSGQSFSIGSYEVEYRALDIHGNVAYCRFRVIVLDGEAPGFISCPDSFEVYILPTQQSVVVTWEAPMFDDNSIQGTDTAELSADSSGPGSRLTPGLHNITYVAMDASGNTASTCRFTVNVMPLTDTVQLDGELTLDVVRGINGRFSDTAPRMSGLRNDLDDLFRISSSLAPDFVGIDITGTTFDADSNFQIQFTLHLKNPSYYNEEGIKQAFYSALTNDLDFPSTNTIVAGSFDLHVTEFRGRFTLQRTEETPASDVLFDTCCADPASPTYRTLEERINRNLWNTFNSNSNRDLNLQNFKTVKALQFRDGSVVVPFTITLDEVTSATPTQAETTFITNVDESTLEWRPGTDLFLRARNLEQMEEVCPSTFMCLNGGTCTVMNATTTYDHVCSCPSGTSGESCENAGIVLSTAAIIGIVVGVVAFLLLLLVVCCCCFFFLSGPRSYRRDTEYGTKAAPLMLMPRDEYIYRRPPIMDRPGPVITEIEEGHEGPYFMHESEDYRSPAPLPLAIEPAQPAKIPRPVTLGPQFLHEYEDHVPPRRRDRDRSRRNRFRDMLPDRLPRARRDNFGPRFQGDSERVQDMKHRLFQEFNY